MKNEPVEEDSPAGFFCQARRAVKLLRQTGLECCQSSTMAHEKFGLYAQGVSRGKHDCGSGGDAGHAEAGHAVGARRILIVRRERGVGGKADALSRVPPVGEQKVRVRMPAGLQARSARLLVAGRIAGIERNGRELTITVPSIRDREVVAIDV